MSAALKNHSYEHSNRKQESYAQGAVRLGTEWIARAEAGNTEAMVAGAGDNGFCEPPQSKLWEITLRSRPGAGF